MPSRLWPSCAGVKREPQPGWRGWPEHGTRHRAKLALWPGETYKAPGTKSAGRLPAIMSVYYMLLDADLFSRRMSPALAASWRLRSFEPCRPLCADLAAAACAFTEHFHTGPEEPLVCKVARDLPFDRHFWHLLVGELLLYAASEVPEIQIAPETLCCLLAAGTYRQGAVPRGCFAPIQQAHFGTRELVFGSHYYRPEHVGYNDPEDVTRLRDYLAAQDPDRWQLADLAGLRDIADDEERREELDFAREWFPVLGELYQRASARRQVIVCENL
jgi:hypothetical protein